MDVNLSKQARRGFLWLFDNYPETLLNLWPPYLGAGIQVESISDDFRRVEVRMPLTPWNSNYVGTQFGGSLYSMCDPFYMLMLMQNLEDHYVVWDKAGNVRFRRPGTGTVYATFEIDQSDVDEIRRRVDEHGEYEPEFDVDIVDGRGELVAEIEKTLHVHTET